MKRRNLLKLFVMSFCGTLTGQSPAQSKKQLPLQTSLIAGYETPEAYVVGVRLVLEPGWKTYWRTPGQNGIAPELDWAGSQNLKSAQLLFPLPQRYQDASGEMIGYKNEVVFPIRITPQERAAALHLQLKLFFGLCDTICIPAEAVLQLALPAPIYDEKLLKGWMEKIPEKFEALPPQTNITTEFATRAGKLFLILKTTDKVQDLFIESHSLAYFATPEINEQGHEIWVPILNIKNRQDLLSKPITITIVAQNKAKEYSLTLPAA